MPEAKSRHGGRHGAGAGAGPRRRNATPGGPVIRIGDRVVGGGHPCFIIAEAGVNHNGDVGMARNLVDAAKRAGADAVKFQTFTAERLATRQVEKAGYQKRSRPSETQFVMLKGLELPADDLRKVAARARKKGIMFLSTPFDCDSVKTVARLRVPAFKVSSGDVTTHPLLACVGRQGRPVILSTGMATLAEVGEALAVLRQSGAREVALLHCTTEYPARFDEANLRAICTLREEFRVPVGFSDHTPGIAASIAAVALGACIIEKHFTLDRDLPGPDHQASLEPGELGELVRSVRQVEEALGTGLKAPTKREMGIRKVARRSIVAREDLSRGARVTAGMIDFKRPGTGISPADAGKVIGRRLVKDLRKDELFLWEYIQ